jgi:hypothetical protein
MSRSNKKAGKREARVKTSKTARRPAAAELTEEQLERVGGGVASFTGIKGEATKDGHKEQIEIASWSLGASNPTGGLKSR